MTEHRCFEKSTSKGIKKYWISLYKWSLLLKISVECKTPIGLTRCPLAAFSLYPYCGQVWGVAWWRSQNVTSVTKSDGSPNLTKHQQPVVGDLLRPSHRSAHCTEYVQHRDIVAAIVQGNIWVCISIWFTQKKIYIFCSYWGIYLNKSFVPCIQV